MLPEKQQLPRICQVCGKPLKGRSDKKFCDDFCRNIFNNLARGRISSYMRGINEILRRNRKVLEDLIPGGERTVKVSREELQAMGFNFNHVTHFYPMAADKIYYFCYEYGFLPEGNDLVFIFRKDLEE